MECLVRISNTDKYKYIKLPAARSQLPEAISMQNIQQLQSGELIGTKHLKFSCGLTAFPLEILDLADTLEILDLSNNQLESLPNDFGKLHQLKIAFFSDNNFTELPSVLGQCKNLEMVGFKSNKITKINQDTFPEKLRWLILTNNFIEEIPASFGKCNRMQKLALAGNQIKQLPAEMANLKNLELIRISDNLLTEIPSWIFELPKLSWIAFAGNPVSEMEQITHSLSGIDWNHLDIQNVLGQGASGIISKAILKDEEVAVKIFKGDVTSDGSPLNEKNATMAAGLHPNLVQVLGKIINHPDDKKGLVLGLIPPSFKNLGNPPNYETCSRDTFNENTVFTSQEILKIAKGISSVAKHLHALGINHGDLYAHNIMYDETANNLLGDFGAATFYNPKSNEAEAIEKIEVRAFGCLLDDMLMHTNEIENNSVIQLLAELRNDCMQESILSRPNFESICEQLDIINL
jgi:hypothetical protein